MQRKTRVVAAVFFTALSWWMLMAFPAGLTPGGAGREAIVVCHYNLENYVGEDQAAQGERRARPKSEEDIAVLIRIIQEVNPDVLGVCEMGSPAQFADFQARLKKAGLGYIDAEYVQGPDPDRHLALLSRFPIVARQSRADVSFTLDGRPEKVRRGFLDVTLQINAGYRLRLVGVHLKSKLAAPENEALLRRHEAHLLREHLDGIFATEPGVNLMCYGDFNELRNTPNFAQISGLRGSPGSMSDLGASDSVGDRWTQYWKAADLYSRIDYLLVSRGLRPEVAREGASIYRSKDWNKASDHRPISVRLVPVERR